MPQLAQWLRHLASKSNKRWRNAANLGVAAKVPIERIKAKLMIEKKTGLGRTFFFTSVPWRRIIIIVKGERDTSFPSLTARMSSISLVSFG